MHVVWWTFSCIFQHLFFYRSHGAKSADCALIGTWGWLDRNESETGKIHWMCHASVWRHMVRVSDSILPHLIFMSCCCICDIYKIYIYIYKCCCKALAIFLSSVCLSALFFLAFFHSFHPFIHPSTHSERNLPAYPAVTRYPKTFALLPAFYSLLRQTSMWK